MNDKFWVTFLSGTGKPRAFDFAQAPPLRLRSGQALSQEKKRDKDGAPERGVELGVQTECAAARSGAAGAGVEQIHDHLALTAAGLVEVDGDLFAASVAFERG